MRQIRVWRVGFVACAVGAGSGYLTVRRHHRRSMFPKQGCYQLPPVDSCLTPSRSSMLERLENEKFDVIVIGGGATGAGVALDCATRGIKCALLESDDFSSGTSSRSTKLLHGGIRYLEAAIKQRDFGQLSLVWEALEERAHGIKSANHMAHTKAIIMPLYSWWQVPYCWIGVKAYDWLAKLATCFDTAVPSCFYLSPSNSRYFCPLLQPNGLRGSLVYYDGMHNDARMNLTVALTSAIPEYVQGMQPAAIANHCRVVAVLKHNDGRLAGVKVLDQATGKSFSVFGNVVVNCTGPDADSIRALVNTKSEQLVSCSAGAHLVLPEHYCPSLGMIIPKTSSGSVLFVLPWEDSTIVGTTDTPATFSDCPRGSKRDVDFIVNEVVKYLKVDPVVLRNDIRAVWSGLRPLAKDIVPAGGIAGSSSTVKQSRSHRIIEDPESGLVSVIGGKWTTYRRMAEDTVDFILSNPKFKVTARTPCRTKQMKLFSAVDPSGKLNSEVVDYHNGAFATMLAAEYKLPFKTATHLVRNYGFQARGICNIGRQTGTLTPLLNNYPFVKAEITWAVKNEMALTLSDVLCRRLRIGFLDPNEASQIVGEVAEEVGAQLGWSAETKQREIGAVTSFVESLHIPGAIMCNKDSSPKISEVAAISPEPEEPPVASEVSPTLRTHSALT